MPESRIWKTHGPSFVVLPLALAVYVTTAARTVTLVDSGELILACAQLGVAHPPGFPVYTALGYLFSLLPIGSIAFRLSFMSSVFAAVAGLLTAVAVVELTTADQTAGAGLPARKSRGKKSRGEALAAESAWETRFERVLPLAVGLCLAFSVTLWFYSTVAEVYSLHLALMAAVLWLLLRWRRQRQGDDGAARWSLALAGLCYGLALGVHHVTVALAAPAIFVFVVRTAGWRVLWRREALMAAGAILVGLGSYLYLPWAASRDPLFNWGDPATVERFWWHVSAKQYRVYLTSDSAAIVANLKFFVALWWRQLTPLGWLIAAVGLYRFWRRDRSVFWLLVWVTGLTVAYASQYDIAEDSDAYFLLPFLGTALALAAGLRHLWQILVPRRAVWGRVILVVTVMLPLANLFLHYRENDRRDYAVARNYTEDALASVGQGGLLMTRDWQLYAPFLYYHHLEGLRPDVTVIDINLLRRSWYVDYLDRVYPEMMTALASERDAYLALLLRFEHDKPYDGEVITRRFNALLEAMIAYHLPEREAHLSLPLEPGIGQSYGWQPVGLTFKLSPAGQPVTAATSPELRLEPLMSAHLDEVAREKVRPTYAFMLTNRARFLLSQNRPEGALEKVEAALDLEATSETALQTLAEIEVRRGRPDAAAAAYRVLLEAYPGNEEARQRLEALSSLP